MRAHRITGWGVGERYAREYRDDEKKAQEYREFENMITKLTKIERKKSGTSAIPDATDIKEFLEAEAALDQLFKLRSGALV